MAAPIRAAFRRLMVSSFLPGLQLRGGPVRQYRKVGKRVKCRAAVTDRACAMEPRRWTFVRPAEHLELRQSETTGTYYLTVDCNGSPRAYEFPSEAAVARFQTDMEVFL